MKEQEERMVARPINLDEAQVAKTTGTVSDPRKNGPVTRTIDYDRLAKVIAEKSDDPEEVKKIILGLQAGGIASRRGGGMSEEERKIWISNLKTIKEVRLAVRRAQSKKGKSNNKDRFQREVEFARSRERELREQAAKHPKGRLHGLIELGEDPALLCQPYIEHKELKVEVGTLKYQGLGLSKRQFKQLASKMDPKIVPDDILADLMHYDSGGDLKARYIDRSVRDRRAIALNQKVQLLTILDQVGMDGLVDPKEDDPINPDFQEGVDLDQDLNKDYTPSDEIDDDTSEDIDDDPNEEIDEDPNEDPNEDPSDRSSKWTMPK